MIHKVNAAVIFVHDLDAAMRFYRDVLDLKVTFSDDVSYAFQMEDQDFALVDVSAGVQMLGQEVFAAQTSTSHRVMLCANTDNVDLVYNALVDKGVKFIRPPVDQHWGWRTAYFADPEGTIWELRQAIPPLSSA